MVKICIILICAKKIFLAKLFIWLIKKSVSPQFYAIFRKMNFWRNIDRRGPYKNGENLNYLKLSKENTFWQNCLFHSSKEVFLHNFTQFLENWIFEGISTGAHLTKWWKFELSQFVLRKYFLSKLFVPLIKGSVSPQFYTIFGKLNFWRNIDRRGPYKNGEHLNYLKLCKENIFVKIICSTHQRKCSSTILGNFGKIEFLKEFRQAQTLKNGDNLNFLNLC